MSGRSVLAISLALAACATAAGQEDLHIAGGRRQSFNWVCADGAGYNWDITSYGQVGDGSDDAYDGGMRLTVNGSTWSYSAEGQLREDGREVEIGPWRIGAVQVWRRIYVDDKLGYCRWIDIFENTGSTNQNAKLQYYTNTGGSTQRTFTTLGQQDLTDKDWGIVTSYEGEGSRPALVHVFASRNSKVRPRFQWTRNSDSLYYHVTVDVPAGKTVALCFFEAQRRGFDAATQFLKDFRVERELRVVPPALRRIILNMGGAMLSLGAMELPRHESHDLVIKRNGDELLGELTNESYRLETFFGTVELHARQVVGLSVPAEGDGFVLIGLCDGQVISGKLLSGPLELRLAEGGKQTLPAGAIMSASYRVSPERPQEMEVARPVLVLRSGLRLLFKPEDLDATFHTEYGDLKLNPAHLQAIYLDTPEGGLHRAVFQNGSIVSGLLVADTIRLRTDFGPELAASRARVEQIVFPPAADRDRGVSAEMVLRNDDVLIGRFDLAALTVETQHGRVRVSASDLAEITFQQEAGLGSATVKMHNGTILTGRVIEQVLPFRIDPEPVVPVFVGHIVQATCPKGSHESPSPASMPAPDTQPAGPDLPATPAPSAALSKEQAVRLKQLDAELAHLQAMLAELDAVQQQYNQAANVDADVTAKLSAERNALERKAEGLQALRNELLKE